MHADQRAAVERVREMAGRKGVDLGFDWLQYNKAHKWWVDKHTAAIPPWVSEHAAALIVTGALSKWLAGQGIAVAFVKGDSEVGPCDSWYKMTADMGIGFDAIKAHDMLSALLAATLARLLCGIVQRCAAAPSAPPPASKEHP